MNWIMSIDRIHRQNKKSCYRIILTKITGKWGVFIPACQLKNLGQSVYHIPIHEY